MQKKNSSYVCELCQRNGKCIESVLAIEDENSEESKPSDVKTVSTSNEVKHPSQLSVVNGKVCSQFKYRVLPSQTLYLFLQPLSDPPKFHLSFSRTNL